MSKKRSRPHKRPADVSREDRSGRAVHSAGARTLGVREPMPPRDSRSGFSVSVKQVRHGLPTKALGELARTLDVDRTVLADVLGISVRTLQRKAEDNDRLGPVVSDRLARVHRILNLAERVLGETRKASRWLTSQSRALGGEVPLRMLDTDIGAQRVEQELRQIEFGMPF